jgi:putative FmdB family regulatory protein
MPVYEYRCDDCNEKTEQVRAVADRSVPAVCPKCGRQTATLIISLNTFILKGSGWSNDSSN